MTLSRTKAKNAWLQDDTYQSSQAITNIEVYKSSRIVNNHFPINNAEFITTDMTAKKTHP